MHNEDTTEILRRILFVIEPQWVKSEIYFLWNSFCLGVLYVQIKSLSLKKFNQFNEFKEGLDNA